MIVYLTDSSFIDTSPSTDVTIGPLEMTADSVIGQLTYAVSFLPIAAGPGAAKRLYHAIEGERYV